MDRGQTRSLVTMEGVNYYIDEVVGGRSLCFYACFLMFGVGAKCFILRCVHPCFQVRPTSVARPVSTHVKHYPFRQGSMDLRFRGRVFQRFKLLRFLSEELTGRLADKPVRWLNILLTGHFDDKTIRWLLAGWMHLSTLLLSCYFVTVRESFCQRNVLSANWLSAKYRELATSMRNSAFRSCSIITARPHCS